jgi:hypothetical protein
MQFITAAVFVLATASAAQPAAAQWATTTLDRANASSTQLWGINDLGQIAGSDSLGGFIYSAGVAADMPSWADSSRIVPFGISNAGVIVGSWMSATDNVTHGFVYQQGSYSNWDVPLAGVTATQIRSISLDGRTIAGYFNVAGVQSNKGFVYDTSLLALTTLEPVPGSVILQGTNSAGQTTGNLNGVPANQGINGGVVVGADGRYTVYASVAGVTGRPTFRAINDAGLVAGFAPQTDGTSLSFLGNPLGNSAFQTLAMPGAVSTNAEGLNNSNSLVGFYTDSDQLTHGFLATPVPEPATACLWLAAAVGGLGVRRLRAAEVQRQPARIQSRPPTPA